MMKIGCIRIVCLLLLGLGLPALATAEARRTCSVRQIAGDWAYSKTGTLTLPNGVTVGFAAVGRITVDANGTLSGTQDNNIGGSPGQGLLSGTYSLNEDCTATLTVDVLDAGSGALLRTVVMSAVFDHAATELRMMVTRLVLPNGLGLAQVITGSAARMETGREGGR